MPSSSFLAHAALLTVAIIYGANYSIAKLVMDPGYVGPSAFIVLRVGGAGLLLWLLHLVTVRERIAQQDIRWLVYCAVFGVAINMLCFFHGLRLTTAISAGLIMTSTPIFVLLFSALLLGERIGLSRVAGVLLGATGAALLVIFQHRTGEKTAANSLLGNLLVMANAASYGCYLVLVKRLMSRYQPLTVIKWIFTLGFVLVLPFGLRGVGAIDWCNFNGVIWGAVLYVIVGVTFLTYVLNAYALQRVTPSTVSVYIYLQPVVAAVVALLLGQESMTYLKLAAGLLIFAGVWLVSRPVGKRATG